MSLLLAASIPNPASAVNWPPTSVAMDGVATFTFITAEQRAQAAQGKKLLAEGKWSEAAAINSELIMKMPKEVFNGQPLPFISIRTEGEKPLVQKKVDGWQWRLELAWLQVLAMRNDDAIRQFKLIINEHEDLREPARQGLAFALVRGGYFQEGYGLWRELESLTPGQVTALSYAATPTQDAWLSLHNLAMASVLQGQIGSGLPIPNRTEPPKEASGSIEASLVLAEQALRQKNAQQVRLYTTRLGVLLGKDGPPIYRALNIEIQRAASKL